MNSSTKKTTETSNTLANAICKNLNIEKKTNEDEISLHPDEHDIGEEVDDVVENELLNPKEGQTKVEPRPLFMGPAKKHRRSRKGNKNMNPKLAGKDMTSDTAQVDNGIEPQPGIGVNLAKSSAKFPSFLPSTVISEINSSNKATNSPKRQRSNQNSPNAANNEPKRQKTFADVVSGDLKLQITNKNGGIDESQLGKIESVLMYALDEYLASNPSQVPTFHTSSFRDGVLKIICTDEFSANWMKNIVKNINPPWEGAILEIDTCKPINTNPMAPFGQRREVVRRPSIRFFIPDGTKRPSFEEVIKKFQYQNQPLDTSEWIAWKADDKGNGIFYHVSVDDQHIKWIKTKSSRLFYCFSKIKINLPKEPKGDGSEVGMRGNVQTEVEQ